MQKKPPSRILLVRLSALGDVVQTLPVLACIRQTYPEATIGWLVEAGAAEILKGNPMLNHLHISDRKRWVKSLRNPLLWWRTVCEIRQFLSDIQSVGYEVAIDLQGLMKSGVTIFLTGIKRRIGFRCAREMAPLFYTEKCDIQGDFFADETPILQHLLVLTEAIGCMPSQNSYPLPPINPEAERYVTDLLAGLGTQSPVVAITPATQWQSKHWPTQYWTQLVQEILEKTPFNLVILGGKKDLALCQSILEPIPHYLYQGRLLNLAGQTSLAQLIAVLHQVQSVVGLDSGPLHLAGAVGKAELIGIYGPTAYRRTPPPGHEKVTLLSLESKEELSCQPCDQDKCHLGTQACMYGIRPQEVFQSLVLCIETT